MEFRTLVHIATERAKYRKEKRLSRKSVLGGLRASLTPANVSERSGCEELTHQINELSQARSSILSIPEEDGAVNNGSKPLPRTLNEVLPPSGDADDRAIVVIEAKHPFAVVGCNQPWEDLCGFNEKEAVGEPMSHLIQGPKTNREGLKKSMEELIGVLTT